MRGAPSAGRKDQTYEDDYIVNTIDKLRREMCLNGGGHKLFRLGWDGTVGHVGQKRGAEVGRHDDDRVPVRKLN